MLDVIAWDLAAGYPHAEAYLAMVADLLPAELPPDSANSFCWTLGALTFCEKDRGRQSNSVELIILALRLEEVIDRLDMRAFLYCATPIY